METLVIIFKPLQKHPVFPFDPKVSSMPLQTLCEMDKMLVADFEKRENIVKQKILLFQHCFLPYHNFNISHIQLLYSMCLNLLPDNKF